jgi:hypothetical protein
MEKTLDLLRKFKVEKQVVLSHISTGSVEKRPGLPEVIKV